MYEYLDYTSPLDYFNDVVVQYNLDRPKYTKIIIAEMAGSIYVIQTLHYRLTTRSSLILTSRHNFHCPLGSFTSYNTF